MLKNYNNNNIFYNNIIIILLIVHTINSVIVLLSSTSIWYTMSRVFKKVKVKNLHHKKTDQQHFSFKYKSDLISTDDWSNRRRDIATAVSNLSSEMTPRLASIIPVLL